ncbi:MAG TPA: DUF2155 domain-containing protein [Pseudolabrys sp.]|jgi:hypothetical protein
MGRPIGPVALLTVAALFVAQPAPAQFGSIFSDPPPRPPADVPGSRSPPSQQPYYPGRDEPPSQPLPAPMSLPPSNRPGGGGVQSQPLPPPPGGIVAPAPPPGQVPQGAAVAPGQPAPLPPGPGSPRNAPQPANTAPQPSDEIVVAPSPQRINNPTAVFSGLDKITGRIISFDVAINETVQFGALQVTPRVCYSRPPTETPNTDAFVEVDEVTLQGEIKRIFTGWMFAASPGLHAVEHPIYDVWVTNCKGGQSPAVAEVPPEAPKQPARQQQQRRTPPPPPPSAQRPPPPPPPPPSAQRTPPPQQPSLFPFLR